MRHIVAVLLLAIVAFASASEQGAEAQRVLGVVNVHHSPAQPDPRAVEYADTLRSDLNALTLLRSKVHAMLAKSGVVAKKLTHMHNHVLKFTAALDKSLQQLDLDETREVDSIQSARLAAEMQAQHEDDLDARDHAALINQLQLVSAARRPVVVQSVAAAPVVQTVQQVVPVSVAVPHHHYYYDDAYEGDYYGGYYGYPYGGYY